MIDSAIVSSIRERIGNRTGYLGCYVVRPGIASDLIYVYEKLYNHYSRLMLQHRSGSKLSNKYSILASYAYYHAMRIRMQYGVIDSIVDNGTRGVNLMYSEVPMLFSVRVRRVSGQWKLAKQP